MAFKTDEFIDFPETDVVTDPASGEKRLYFKTNHKLYYRNNSGAESEVGSGGGGGSGIGGTQVTLQTVNGTEASIVEYTLTDNTTATFTATITATRSDGAKQLSAVIVYSAYRDGAGAIELIGNSFLAQNAWDAAIFTKCEFDVNGNDVRLRIAGVAATTINWCVVYNVVVNNGLSSPTTVPMLNVGGVSNLSWTYNDSLGAHKIAAADGSDLSAVNPGWVSVPSTSLTGDDGSESIVLKVTSNITFNCYPSHTSHLVGYTFGLQPSKPMARDLPIFLLAINTDNTSAGLVFGLCRSYKASSFASDVPLTSSNANYLGNMSASPVISEGSEAADYNIFLMTNSAVAGFVSKPLVAIGAGMMMKEPNHVNPLLDDAIIRYTAIGSSQVLRNRHRTYSLIEGQNGGLTLTTPATSTFLYTPGGDGANDVPVFGDGAGGYIAGSYGVVETLNQITVSFNAGGSNCTNGDINDILYLVLPRAGASVTTSSPAGFVVIGGVRTQVFVENSDSFQIGPSPDNYYNFIYFMTAAGTTIKANMFSDANDELDLQFSYFDYGDSN